MVRIERGNVVLRVQEHEVQRYIKLGYNVTDETGKVLKEAIPNDFGVLQRHYVESKKKIEELELTVIKLTEEKEELQNAVTALAEENSRLAQSAKPTKKKPETTETPEINE
jgi:methyl coenzyme M reductase subunit D